MRQTREDLADLIDDGSGNHLLFKCASEITPDPMVEEGVAKVLKALDLIQEVLPKVLGGK